MRALFDRMGGRKLLLGLLVIAIGVVMDIITPTGLHTNLLYLLCFVSTSFFLANSAASIAYSRKPDQTTSQPPIDLEPTHNRLDLLQSQLNQTAEGVNTITQAISHIIKRAGFDK